MMFLLLSRVIGVFLPLILTAVVSAEESQLSTSWETQIVESLSTSATAATTSTRASASSVDVFIYCFNATNETTPYCSSVFVESPSVETNINETTPWIDVKVEDNFDVPTPSDVPTNNADDKNVPSSFSSPTFDAPYAWATKSPSASPATSIRDNLQGELDHPMSSTSILVTAAGVVQPMKAVGFFSGWFHLRTILQQYLPNDFLQWRLHVHRDFSTFMSDGQQQSVVNSLCNNPLGRCILKLFAKLGLVAQYQVDDMSLQLDQQRNEDFEQARPIGAAYIQQMEQDERTNYITPEWRLNMLETTPLHPIHEEMLAAGAVSVLMEDILTAGAIAILAEDYAEDQADEIPFEVPMNVPYFSITEAVVAFETELDQPVCVAVTEDSLVCDIVKGEICIDSDAT